MKNEWWYDGSEFLLDEIGKPFTLHLARLTHFDSGSVEILFPSEATRIFSSYDEATTWLRDEEYDRLDDLVADYKESGLAPPSELAPPQEPVVAPKKAMVISVPRCISDAT